MLSWTKEVTTSTKMMRQGQKVRHLAAPLPRHFRTRLSISRKALRHGDLSLSVTYCQLDRNHCGSGQNHRPAKADLGHRGPYALTGPEYHPILAHQWGIDSAPTLPSSLRGQRKGAILPTLKHLVVASTHHLAASTRQQQSTSKKSTLVSVQIYSPCTSPTSSRGLLPQVLDPLPKMTFPSSHP